MILIMEQFLLVLPITHHIVCGPGFHREIDTSSFHKNKDPNMFVFNR